MVKKRGQVTLFIIVGVVILFSAVLLFYIRGQVEEKALAVEEEPIIAEVPSELLPVKSYVESCIEQVAKQGLSDLGQHGGYIDLDDPETGVTFLAGHSPTSSDYVEFVPGSDDKIPYWYYLRTPNGDQSTCEYFSKRPPLRKTDSTLVGGSEASIERQLERYVDAELVACLRNFAPLAEQGFTVTPTRPISKVTVANKDVRFLVTYPLTVTREGSVSEVKEFYVKIPLELKRIYDLASEMVVYEQNYTEIEQRMLELISLFSDVDSKKLPPTSEITLDLAPSDVWLTFQVKDNLELMFQAWIRAMQVYGSKNFDLRLVDPGRPYADIIQQVYNNFAWLIEGYEDFEVRFDYLSWWPIYFDINDKGGVFEPSSIVPFLPIFGIQEYRAFYDISIPVYIEIRQPPTIEFPNGYAFRFFIEGNMRNNEALDCQNPPITLSRASETLVCNVNQRNTGNITIRTVESDTNDPVGDVLVTVNIAGQQCIIGTTDDDGVLVTKFPVGYGAIVSLRKLGYRSEVFIDNFEVDVEHEYTIVMDKEVSVDASLERIGVIIPEEEEEGFDVTEFMEDVVRGAITVYTYGLVSLDSPGGAEVFSPPNVTSAIIILNRVKEDQFDEEFSAVVEVYGNISQPLKLVPGLYDIDIQLFVDEEVFIPEERRCPQQICPDDWFTWPFDLLDNLLGTDVLATRSDTCRDECIAVFDYIMPEVNMPAPYVAGGAKLQWHVSSGDLARGNVVFKALQFPKPQKVEDLESMGLIEEYSIKYKTYLVPQFTD